jgi:antitoxin component of MazEF toxin-antitoxin module
MIMERKLVKQGRDALTLTLPAKWLKQKGLKQGDSVFIEQHDNFLKLNIGSRVKFTETTIDARTFFRNYVLACDNSKIYRRI